MSEEIVQRAMRQLSQTPFAPLPDGNRIWWLAEIRRRQETARRVSQTMTRVRIVTSAAVLLTGSGLAIWLGNGVPGLTFLTAAGLLCATAAVLRVVLAKD
jgi:hypothetical protein